MGLPCTKRGHRSSFPNYNVVLSLKVVLILTNSADSDRQSIQRKKDPDEITALHRGFHCLHKYLFWGFLYTKG